MTEMPTVRVVALAIPTNVPSDEAISRTVTDPQVAGTIPVFAKRELGRDLVGTASLTVTDEGVVADMVLAPYIARRLLGGELRAHAETDGGYISHEERGVTIHSPTVRGLYCSEQANAWDGLWVREAGS